MELEVGGEAKPNLIACCPGLTPLAERGRVSLLRGNGVELLAGRAEQEELVCSL